MLEDIDGSESLVQKAECESIWEKQRDNKNKEFLYLLLNSIVFDRGFFKLNLSSLTRASKHSLTVQPFIFENCNLCFFHSIYKDSNNEFPQNFSEDNS